MPRDTLDLCILDTLANDLESLANILRLLNHPQIGWTELRDGTPFSEEEVVPALLRCIEDELVEACAYNEKERALIGLGVGQIPLEDIDALWFLLTPRGRNLHSRWDPIRS